MVKNLPVNAEDIGSILGLGRSSGEGNGNPLQYSCLEYSCLENSMDRWAWWATVYRVAKSRTWLSDWMTTTDLWKCIDPCAPTFPCNFKVCGLAPVYLWTLGQSVENFLALYMQRDLTICIRVIMQNQVRFEERNTHISPDILGEEKRREERGWQADLLSLCKGWKGGWGQATKWWKPTWMSFPCEMHISDLKHGMTRLQVFWNSLLTYCKFLFIVLKVNHCKLS